MATAVDHAQARRRPSVTRRARLAVRRSGVFTGGPQRRLTSPLRVLPDFLILGGVRCGTTSLYWYLKRHPSVVPARDKEPHFFNQRYDRGVGWYRANFPSRPYLALRHLVKRGRSITGEGSTWYLFDPETPPRARALLPAARLIALLRNPVDRAYANYHHLLRKGRETRSFEQAVKEEEGYLASRLAGLVRPEYRGDAYARSPYLARGIYRPQIQRWLAAYPPEQLLVVGFEDLARDPGAAYSRVLEFLGLAPAAPYRLDAVNPGNYEPLDAQMRDHLVEFFRPHNAELFDFLDRDFGWER